MTSAPIVGWIRSKTGLEPDLLGTDSITRIARERLVAAGCAGYDDYVRLLQQCPDECAQFVDRIVVGETWFFREQAALDALVQHAKTAWAIHSETRTFRVLSVPCSTGEEPYSIIMALAMAAWPMTRLQVDAFDLSSENIQHARRGIYRPKAFRANDLTFRAKFFEFIGDNWRLQPSVQTSVRFATGNVLNASFATGSALYDAIFCRNLLIY